MANQKKRETQDDDSRPKRLCTSSEHNNNSTDFSDERIRKDFENLGDERCGIFEWVTVKNFMCHDYLNFEFSPHINFVQGRNGSGKSAILAALVIGLGGGSRFTNRGNTVKDLVKHGKQVATIEVALKNCGRDAFKPALYGITIVVERRICIAGGGGYKLKTKDGTVVSTKKEELVRMLDHFNLQVDNPITILNQDMSRSFLNTVDPKVMYKFFLKATQLQQMKEDYNQLMNSIESSTKIIECRKKSLPELEKELEEQHAIYEFAGSLRENTKKLKELRRELAWANIIYKEKMKASAEAALENHEKAKAKITEKIAVLQGKVDQEKELKAKATEDFKKATIRLVGVCEGVKKVSMELKALKNDYKSKQSLLIVAEKKISRIKEDIATLQAAIDEDNEVARLEWAKAQEEWKKKQEEAKSQIKEIEDTINTKQTQYSNLQNTLDLKTSDKTQLNMEEKALQRKLSELKKELQGLQSQKGSQLTVYGQWVPQLLNKIEAAYAKGAFIKKPVGPLGAFVKVRDPKWAHVAESVLGARVSSFCVDNQKDHAVLVNIMKQMNFDHQSMPVVTVARFRDKVHDVSKFEVRSQKYYSLWSMLNITDTVVANTLIDQMQVESILLIPTPQEAGELLKNKSTVPKNCKCAYTLNLDQYYPDPNFRLYSGKGPHRARVLQVSVKDKINDVNKNKFECEERLQAVTSQQQELQKEIKTLQDEIGVINKSTQQHKRKLNSLRLALENLKNQATPPPPNLTQLEDDVREHEELLKVANAEIEKIKKESNVSQNKFTKMSEHMQSLRQKERETYEEAQKFKEDIDNFSADSALTSISMYKAKLKELEKKREELEEQVKKATESLEGSVKAASENLNLGERIESKKSLEQLQRQYTSLQARYEKEKANSGDPVEVVRRYLATKKRYKELTDDLEKHNNLLKKLKGSLENRYLKYYKFFKWLSVIIKINFTEGLAVRKLNGSLSFNFDNQTLTIHVEKPSSGNETMEQEWSPRKRSSSLQQLSMMSGGERSFATVSFLIALWHTIESPVRILDEFDVFMDVIARNRAMKLMIKAAQPETQYIFLTPLNLDTGKLKNCAIFRMPDPERGTDATQETQEGT